ncbi:tryptophan 2,3-dioxygenase family protein [Photorhabdus khanii]|uniref:Tryptophan 2,3-dioxygenase n=1 Tax=Photorhabdus khanii subsp. guanajuatensis TaxID=2100166 RepID=A0A4R4IY90_9GAMM|nr:tryptophan 2,3-dioxygenase family protein [Photorhabdus khanii]TDB45641.1 tryptophan 2,3-dioxygenase [Photorhabdus khanii subsp. guanajuatensis]
MIGHRNYSTSVLSGEGDSDYEKYMRTPTLLNLQVTPENMLHRDELLFQVVHQSTELWLKLSNNELAEAIEKLSKKDFVAATELIKRSSYPIELITKQLEMFKYMTPYDFQKVRPALGNGSGFESPGWRRLQSVGQELHQTFIRIVKSMSIDLMGIYTEEDKSPLYFLMEEMVSWDEMVSLWRSRHYKIAVRTIGLNTIGTKGTPVEKLTVLMNKQFFPELWVLRTEMTNTNSY